MRHIYCLYCGMKRSRGNQMGVVLSAAGDSVTIHDFPLVAHPYVTTKREEDLDAMDEILGRRGGLLFVGTKPLPSRN